MLCYSPWAVLAVSGGFLREDWQALLSLPVRYWWTPGVSDLLSVYG